MEEACVRIYAVSSDVINWERRDDLFELPRSEDGWNSEMACYPVVLKTKTNDYMFYNGNGVGKVVLNTEFQENDYL